MCVCVCVCVRVRVRVCVNRINLESFYFLDYFIVSVILAVQTVCECTYRPTTQQLNVLIPCVPAQQVAILPVSEGGVMKMIAASAQRDGLVLTAMLYQVRMNSTIH